MSTTTLPHGFKPLFLAFHTVPGSGLPVLELHYIGGPQGGRMSQVAVGDKPCESLQKSVEHLPDVEAFDLSEFTPEQIARLTKVGTSQNRFQAIKAALLAKEGLETKQELDQFILELNSALCDDRQINVINDEITIETKP